MKKCRVKVLSNGLTLVWIKTNKRFSKMASLIVKFGGFNKEIDFNGEKIKIKDGTAHFIEHLLIENSMYGNVLLEFDKNNSLANAFTNSNITSYWFKSLYDFEDNLIKLINVVNNPVFDKKGIDYIKDAIIQEKMRKDDNKYYDFYSAPYSCLFKDLKDPNVLGEVDDIKNMSYDYIKKIYDILYNPSNQILLVNGNINFEKIKNMVEKTYEKFNKKIDYKIPKLELSDEIYRKECVIKKDVPSCEATIAIKINIKKYTSLEKLKFDYYVNRFIRYKLRGFDEEVAFKQISTRGLGYRMEIIGDFCILYFTLVTDKVLEFKKMLFEYLEEKTIPKKDFELANKKDLITLLLREDDSFGQVDPLIDNIFSYNYYDIDTPELIESFDYDEFSTMIKDIDFNNYSLIKLEKEGT